MTIYRTNKMLRSDLPKNEKPPPNEKKSFKKSSFEMLMSELEKKKKLKLLSFNEERSVRLNRMEKKRFDRLLNLINKEARHSKHILEEDIELAEKKSYKVASSTGTIFSPKEIDDEISGQSKLDENKLLKKRRSFNKYALWKNYTFLNPSCSDLSFEPKPVKTYLESNSVRSLNEQIDFKREFSLHDLKQENKAIDSALEKFLDKRNRVKYRPQDKRLIKCRNTELLNRKPSIFNGQRLDKLNEDGGRKIQNDEFEFKDEQMFKIYVQLCEIRDSIPILPRQKIKELKKKDPIFAKRYKEFQYFKAKYRAPDFEFRDNLYMPSFPKLIVEKDIERYVKIHEEEKRKLTLPKLNMSHVFEKTRRFMSELCDEN